MSVRAGCDHALAVALDGTVYGLGTTECLHLTWPASDEEEQPPATGTDDTELRIMPLPSCIGLRVL
jgi:hypothetical protein